MRHSSHSCRYPKRFKPKKLPLINKQITTSHLGDINSKTSDLSTEVNKFNFVLKVEKDNNGFNYIKKIDM